MTEHRSRPPGRPPGGGGGTGGGNPWGPRRDSSPSGARPPREDARPQAPEHREAQRTPRVDDTRRGEGRPDAGRPYASRPPQARPHDPRSRQHARPYEPRARDARPYDAHGDDARHEPRHDARHEEPGDEAAHTARTHRQTELRLYGLNAVNAVFSRRPEAIRKLYLLESRIPAVQPMLKWCVAHRVGYRVAEEADLDRLAASTHHEGLVADVLREEPQTLSPWLRDLPAGPQCALWLDGVGNPHNFGAILRSAAHFGVSAVLLPKHSPLALSGAAARVAEGGAEIVPLVRLGRSDNAIAQLRSAGFTLAATLVHGGRDVFTADLPERVVYVIGAEGEGMDRDLAQACDMRISIPGTGAVESLNVAAATAVLLARWRHR